MTDIISTLLLQKKEAILKTWEDRCIKEVLSAGTVKRLVLRDSLPLYIDHLAESLKSDKKMDFKSVFNRDEEGARIGRLHGADRAATQSYGLSEMIFEYHILRETIFSYLEVDGCLPENQRDILLDSLEQAVNDAAVEFSEAHAEIQEKFVNTLTHDLKSPITAAKLSAQMILRRNDMPGPAIDSSKRIVGSMTRIEGMIQDLLDASRVRSGEMLDLRFEDCDLETVVREVIEEMTFIHGDRFYLDSKETLEGHWARDGLRRSLENLMGNAVKYGTPQSMITVCLRRKENDVEIAVHNSGKAISEKDIPFLFQQFRRTTSAKEGGKAGWGLGLTLVKGVVDACQGTITVESSTEGGTRFTLTLPESRRNEKSR
jgi:signal transduction histidine kinase